MLHCKILLLAVGEEAAMFERISVNTLYYISILASKETSANGKYFYKTIHFLLAGWASPASNWVVWLQWWAVPTLLKDAEFSLEESFYIVE